MYYIGIRFGGSACSAAKCLRPTRVPEYSIMLYTALFFAFILFFYICYSSDATETVVVRALISDIRPRPIGTIRFLL